jgi:hypothetical protein
MCFADSTAVWPDRRANVNDGLPGDRDATLHEPVVARLAEKLAHESHRAVMSNGPVDSGVASTTAVRRHRLVIGHPR